MDSTIYFEVFVLIDVLVGDVFCNHIVRHVTGTATVMIDTSCWPQMSRIRSRNRVATSPCKAGLRYFVIHTRCKWISKYSVRASPVFRHPRSLPGAHALTAVG